MWYDGQYHRQKQIRIKAFLSPVIRTYCTCLRGESLTFPPYSSGVSPLNTNLLLWIEQCKLTAPKSDFFPSFILWGLLGTTINKGAHTNGGCRLRAWEVGLVKKQTNSSTQKQCARMAASVCSSALNHCWKVAGIFFKSSGFGISSLQTHRPILWTEKFKCSLEI